jgi:hypothetical protein
MDRATKRVSCRIQFRGNKDMEFFEGIIEDVFTKDKEEYLKTDSGLLIRLDMLISIDNIILSQMTD